MDVFSAFQVNGRILHSSPGLGLLWDPRDGIDPSKESFEEEVDPRAAETSVPIDEHPFLAALKEGPKVRVAP